MFSFKSNPNLFQGESKWKQLISCLKHCRDSYLATVRIIMKTYDLVHKQIMKEKIRIDKAIQKNADMRRKCLEALGICQMQIKLSTKGTV